jgi:hypothetical protein
MRLIDADSSRTAMVVPALAIAILPIVAVLGCGGGGGGSIDGSGGGGAVDGGGVVSCTVTEDIPSTGQTLLSCEEVSGPFAPSLKANCPPPTTAPPGIEVQSKGEYADGPCSRAGLVGGCTITVGAATSTFWYYETPSSSPDVMSLCAMPGLTYIAP